MGFKTKKKEETTRVLNHPNSHPNSNDFMAELQRVINGQAEAIRSLANKNAELSFVVAKLSEQVQITRVHLRMQKDKLNVLVKTFSELGIIDDTILSVAFGLVENKLLPITSEGIVSRSISLSRYSPPANMPSPKHSSKSVLGVSNEVD